MKLIDHDEMLKRQTETDRDAEETDRDANVDQEPFHVEPRSFLSKNVDSISDAQYGYEMRGSDRILPEIELGGNQHNAESDADEATRLPDTDLRDSEKQMYLYGVVIPAETDVLNAY